MERAKQMYLSHYRSLPKSLERATADRIMAAMMGPDRLATLEHATSTVRCSASGMLRCNRYLPLVVWTSSAQSSLP